MIYLTDVSRLDPADSFWQPFLSPERKEKLAACKTREDRQRCLGVELLLCYAIRNEHLPLALPLRYQREANGKPYFSEERIFFSLSHSGKYAACAISEQPIGIDIQLRQGDHLLPLQRLLTKNQQDMIASMPPQKQKDAVFDFWCLKESLYKVTGQVSLRQPVEFQFANEGGRLAVFYEEYTLQCFQTVPGYSLAVCTPGAVSPYLFHLSAPMLKKALEA